MIRLDGNSLAAFRGAGVAGTVQSVAGCELFGAARMPSWASPYSAAATRALKAQFPTQWPTIRDYGFSHPEIVGYMNAYAPEDAKIAYSLVEGIGTRWLVGDGTAYINSGWIPKESNFEIKTRYKYKRLGTNMALYANRWNEGNGLVFMCGANYAYIQTSTSIQRNVNLGITVGADVKMSHTVSAVTTEIGGVTRTSSTGVSTINNAQELWICGKQNGADLFFDGDLAYWQLLFGTAEQMNLVPYKKNGAMGMIDLLTGTFYGNANSSGSFSESIESPA